MTHTNLLFEAYALDAVLGVQFGDRATSYLPSAHIADRMMALYNQEVFGTQVTVISDAARDCGRAARRAARRSGARCHGFGKSSRRQSNSRSRTSRTRQSARLCNGPCRSPRNAPRHWSPANRCPTTWPPNGRRPTSWCCRSCGRSWGWTSCGGRCRVRRRFRKETLAFFAGIGIPIAEVWGMSELSCVASVSHPARGAAGHASASCCPGWRARSPRTANIWCVDRW